MVTRKHNAAIALTAFWLPMHLGDSNTRQEFCHRIPAKGDDDFGVNHQNLRLQPRGTRLNFLGLRITIFWWTAFDHIRDINILSRHTDGLKKLIKKFSRGAHKRQPLEILIFPRPLAHHQNIRLFRAHAWHVVRDIFMQLAARASIYLLMDVPEQGRLFMINGLWIDCHTSGIKYLCILSRLANYASSPRLSVSSLLLFMAYYIIDGNAYIYRAFFAIPPFKTSSGIYTNAVYGFAKMLMKLMKEKDGDQIVVAFDHKKKSFRHEMFESYKAHRAKMPEEMIGQLPYIKKLVELLHLPIMEIEGMEADDAIASFVCQTVEREGAMCYIITGDKDMMQLVNDKVVVYDTMKNIIYDRDGVKAKMGVWPEQIPDLLGLMGDSADNIPGVKGIGPKTAVTLLEQYATIEELLEHADEQKGKVAELLKTHAEDARVSKELATVMCDINLDHLDLKPSQPDMEAIGAMFKELEFYSLLKELGAVTAVTHEETEAPKPSASLPTARETLLIENMQAWQEAHAVLHNGKDLFVHLLPNTLPQEMLLAHIEAGTVYHVRCANQELQTAVLTFLQEALPKANPLLTTHSKALYHILLEAPDLEDISIPQLSLFS